SGNASFNAVLAGASATGELITATATDSSGNTSEFSYAIAAFRPVQTVSVDVQPGSINLDSNGTITLLVYGAADFNVKNITSVSFAGATAWQSLFVDANHDGQLDLQLKFRTPDVHDALLSMYSNWLAANYTSSSSSTRDAALLQVTGEMKDQSLFQGADSATLFLAGKRLKSLLASLFG